jgi:hypothetical protein
MILPGNAITILIVSHNKPQLLSESVESVLGQTFLDWQGILIDSGVLYDQDYFASVPWADDPRLQIVRSHETAQARRHKAMAPWCFNECFRRRWVKGELVMYLCDDDILYPNAFATFVAAFRKNPAAMAMYASQDVGWMRTDGRSEIVGERRALAPGGKCCNGRLMDCQVDYLQLCHRASALIALPDTEYWPEDVATGHHADGLFMEKLGRLYEIHPIDIKVGQNRRTPWSVNLPTGSQAPTTDPPAVAPVHETIMDAWTAVRLCLESNSRDAAVQHALIEFQSKLRLLCEQDQARRFRLASRRYRWVDQLHAVLARLPGARRLLKGPS